MTFLRAGDRVLLTGDSITAWGRDHSDPTSLGTGYALMVAALAAARRPDLSLTFDNRAISGDTTPMLARRWRRSARNLPAPPTVISVLVGVNDTWQWAAGSPVCSAEQYEELLRGVLDSARSELDARFVLVEPFVVPVDADQERWGADLDPRVAVVRRLATEYDTALVGARALFTDAATRTGPAVWTIDGVHPTTAGHGLLAEAWLEAVGVGPAPAVG